jgi:hypothetical protein
MATRTIIWSVLPRFKVFLLVLLAGCASRAPQEASPQQPQQDKSPLAGLPATFANTPGCEDCLDITLTLRPDGAYLVRERLRGSEFYDFGRWREMADGLLLEGGRDAPRRYAPQPPDVLDSLAGTQGGNLKRQARVEALRGPFRVVGIYDGAAFRECRTGLAWPLGESRPAERLKEQFDELRADKRLAASLVAIDGRFEVRGAREVLIVQRPASLLTGERCPG